MVEHPLKSSVSRYITFGVSSTISAMLVAGWTIMKKAQSALPGIGQNSTTWQCGWPSCGRSTCTEERSVWLTSTKKSRLAITSEL